MDSGYRKREDSAGDGEVWGEVVGVDGGDVVEGWAEGTRAGVGGGVE